MAPPLKFYISGNSVPHIQALERRKVRTGSAFSFQVVGWFGRAESQNSIFCRVVEDIDDLPSAMVDVSFSTEVVYVQDT